MEDSFRAGWRETGEELGIDVRNLKKFTHFYNPRGHMINMLYANIDSEDIKKLKPCEQEVGAIAMIEISKLQGNMKNIKHDFVEIGYNPHVHLEKFKGDDGYIAKTPIMIIEKADITFLQGELNRSKFIYRPQGFIELERTVLSQPENIINSQSIIQPCINLADKADPLKRL